MEGQCSEKTYLLAKERGDKTGSDRVSCFQKTKTFFSGITVEPVMVIFGLAYGLETVFITNLWVDKSCFVAYKYGAKICSQLDSGLYTEQQDSVQRLVSEYNVYRHLVEYVPAVVIVMLLGAWGDRRGRRMPLLLPASGQLLAAIGLVANSYWWDLSPSFILLAYVPSGLTGGIMGLASGAYSYITVTTSMKARTPRITVISVTVFLSAPIGKYLGTVIYGQGGYVAVFGTVSLFHFLCISYILCRLKEHPEGADAAADKGSVCKAISPASLKKTLQVVTKAREGRARTHICSHIFICCLQVFNMGLQNYDFLYTRKKFAWDYNTFTEWSIFSTPLSAIGTVLVMPLASYYLRVEDSMLGFAGAVSSLFTYVLRATAPVPWLFYLSSVVSFLSGMVFVASRAAVSKLVEKGEVGAVFAVLAAGEAAIPTISSALLTAIYNNTLETFPGTIYAIAAGNSVIACCMYTWLITHRVSDGLYKQIHRPE